mgnify:CR=1 FL=1
MYSERFFNLEGVCGEINIEFSQILLIQCCRNFFRGLGFSLGFGIVLIKIRVRFSILGFGVSILGFDVFRWGFAKEIRTGFEYKIEKVMRPKAELNAPFSEDF